MTSNPRGRVYQNKPGVTIKKVLSGEIPLLSGEKVNTACSTDIHNVYKSLIKEENRGCELLGKKPYRGMTVNSFVKIMVMARLLGLITLDHEEPARYHAGPLYRIDKTDGVLTVPVSHRRMYQLTDKGREEQTAWNDLTGAYKTRETRETRETGETGKAGEVESKEQ